MEKNKSLELNMLLNAIRGIMRIVFPLITFPYTSKVLGVENLGRYNFSASVVSYFSLIAGLGIATYAVREGAKFRYNRTDFNSFAREMLSFNLVSTTIAYILLFICCLLSSKLYSYSDLILIISVNILFTTIGMDWVYTIYEDYTYITIRSIVVQIISLVLLFVFVKNRDSLIAYTFVMLFSNAGPSLFNFLHIRKYCNPGLTRHIDWKKHTKPIMVLFATSIAMLIYGISDVTVLGIFCGNYEVGIYSVAVKVYEMVKMLLASVIIAALPRLVALLGQKLLDEFKNTAADIYRLLLSLTIPAIVGMIVLSREIVLFISDASYLDAVIPLAILSLAHIGCMCGWFYSQCILVPMNQEGIVFKAAVVSAFTNLVLNIIFIPLFKEEAAAFTTFISELIQFGICGYYGRRYIKIKGIFKLIVKIGIGCIPIIIINYIVKGIQLSSFTHIMIVVVLSVLSYTGIEVMIGNSTVKDLIFKLSASLKKRF